MTKDQKTARRIVQLDELRKRAERAEFYELAAQYRDQIKRLQQSTDLSDAIDFALKASKPTVDIKDISSLYGERGRAQFDDLFRIHQTPESVWNESIDRLKDMHDKPAPHKRLEDLLREHGRNIEAVLTAQFKRHFGEVPSVGFLKKYAVMIYDHRDPSLRYVYQEVCLLEVRWADGLIRYITS
ncbi:MAG TPA: UvrB/UvrC motif-containing protein [Flavobacteriales bacterium]|nr:UvrB/UvrC motif-containing protein [Flavobacteriales bacterium]